MDVCEYTEFDICLTAILEALRCCGNRRMLDIEVECGARAPFLIESIVFDVFDCRLDV